MTLTLQAGKYYRTRDGRKAEVVGHSRLLPHPWIGAVEKRDRAIEWTDTGRHLDEHCDSSSDLVAEWTEPRSGEVWVNIYNDLDLGGAYASRGKADEASREYRIACIRVPWTKGRYDD